jgi:hypothetical protein
MKVTSGIVTGVAEAETVELEKSSEQLEQCVIDVAKDTLGSPSSLRWKFTGERQSGQRSNRQIEWRSHEVMNAKRQRRR